MLLKQRSVNGATVTSKRHFAKPTKMLPHSFGMQNTKKLSLAQFDVRRKIGEPLVNVNGDGEVDENSKNASRTETLAIAPRTPKSARKSKNIVKNVPPTPGTPAARRQQVAHWREALK